MDPKVFQNAPFFSQTWRETAAGEGLRPVPIAPKSGFVRQIGWIRRAFA